MNPLLVGISIYVLCQLAIGIWVARRVRTEDDYLLAGRRLGPGFVTCSVFATWFGAETCVGAAGQIYETGLGVHSVEPFAYGICLIVMGLVFAAPLWRRRITTLADLFRQRFGPGVERFAAVVLIPTSVLWAAAQIRAFGLVLSTSSSLDVDVAIGIAATVAIVYTCFGGLLADVVTDVVQGAALVIGLVVLAVLVVVDVGGASRAGELISAALTEPRAREPVSWLATIEAWALPICGSVVAQEVVSRAIAARSAGVARGAGIAGGVLYVLVGLLPVALGLLASQVMPELDGDGVLPAMAARFLSTFPYVVFAGALVSAILSTVDSALLVASSLLSRNLVLSGGRAVSDRIRVLTARGGVALFGVAAWWLAHGAERVFELVEEASGFGSAGVLVVVSFGLFTRVGRSTSAVLAIAAGVAVWIVAAYVLTDFEYPFLVSLAAALLGYALGLVDRRGPRARGIT